MRKNKILAGYVLLAVMIFLLDRVTKWLVLLNLEDTYHVTSFLSFDLVMNRGISWSLFHSTSVLIFMVLTAFIACIIVGLTVYTIRRWYQGHMIFGEVLTLSGALSNFIDRIIYGGVIDFIVVSVGGWTWPIFNVADCSIVLGILLMGLMMYRAS